MTNRVVKPFLKFVRARLWIISLVIAFASAKVGAQSPGPIIEVPNPPNAASQLAKHYVVLVSLDGFRYDYAKKYGARNLLQVAAHGASAPEGMIPSFPTFTFPNHYSIVTGLYPEHHGIVANQFFDPARQEKYNYTDLKNVTDGSWYGGTPIWTLAEQQGMRAASFFWPGSEAEINGRRPSYYLRYNDKYPDEKRVEQILDWLRLPPPQRPHFITLYYSNVDHAGHTFGPDAPQTAEAVRYLDNLMGQLKAGLDSLRLPIDLIVISDHGMENEQGDWITFEKFTDMTSFETVGPLMYPRTDADAAKVFRALDGKSDKFKVYRRKDFPAYLHFDANPRAGDPIVLPTGPYEIRARAGAGGEFSKLVRGVHGYDPGTMPAMKAIFFAVGPDIREGVTVGPFENVNVYPFIAEILGLEIGPIDGNLRILRGLLKTRSHR